jgi:hypothetical protein
VGAAQPVAAVEQTQRRKGAATPIIFVIVSIAMAAIVTVAMVIFIVAIVIAAVVTVAIVVFIVAIVIVAVVTVFRARVRWRRVV